MSTHTYVVLEISNAAFHEINLKLRSAGYESAFHYDQDKEELVIDMHGIAVTAPSYDGTGS